MTLKELNYDKYQFTIIFFNKKTAYFLLFRFLILACEKLIYFSCLATSSPHSRNCA
jgi:hypothetical protein